MNYNEEQEKINAFKPIKENPIILDFTGFRYIGEIHLMLKEKFGFPEYYGENWDALWDCLAGYCGYDPLTVEIKGIRTLPKEFNEDIEIMLRIFKRVHSFTPNIEFITVS